MGDEDPESAGVNIGNSFGVFQRRAGSGRRGRSAQLAWSVALGYRVNKYLAGEVEYIDFGTTDVAEHYTLMTQLAFSLSH